MEKKLTAREVEALQWLFKEGRSEAHAFELFTDDVGARARHGLRYAGIKTLKELVTAWPRSKLLEIKGFGERSVDKAHNSLRSFGLELQMTEEDYERLRESIR